LTSRCAFAYRALKDNFAWRKNEDALVGLETLDLYRKPAGSRNSILILY